MNQMKFPASYQNDMKVVLCSQFRLWLLLVVAALVVKYKPTYGLSWTDKPGTLTYVQQGRNISIRWHYEITSSEQFLSSELFLKSKSLSLASRYPGEKSYAKYSASKRISFSVSGLNNITLTILDARLSYSGQYCCIVMVKMKTKRGKKVKRMCTALFVYAVPHITNHTPKLSCKQGDQVKVQCNATGYPEPRFEWIHSDTQRIIINSSVTSVNISGKRSGGNYCCYATNQFGNDTKCTSVVVTEYGPVNAILSSNRGCYIKSNTLTLQCQADASPPPRYLFFQNNTLMHNSSDGIYISSNISDHEAVQISCIPWNKYGRGPKKMIILPVFDLPKITNNEQKIYITNRSKSIVCSPTDTSWEKQTEYRVEAICFGSLFIVFLLVSLALVIFIICKKRKVGLQNLKNEENRRGSNKDAKECLNDMETNDIKSTASIETLKSFPSYEQMDEDKPVLKVDTKMENVSLVDETNLSRKPSILVHNFISTPLYETNDTQKTSSLGNVDVPNCEPGLLPELRYSTVLRKQPRETAEDFSKRSCLKVPLYQDVQRRSDLQNTYTSLSSSTKLPTRNPPPSSLLDQNKTNLTEAVQQETKKMQLKSSTSQYQALKQKRESQQYMSLHDSNK